MRELSAKLTEGEKFCNGKIGRIISAPAIFKQNLQTVFIFAFVLLYNTFIKGGVFLEEHKT